MKKVFIFWFCLLGIEIFLASGESPVGGQGVDELDETVLEMMMVLEKNFDDDARNLEMKEAELQRAINKTPLQESYENIMAFIESYASKKDDYGDTLERLSDELKRRADAPRLDQIESQMMGLKRIAKMGRTDKKIIIGDRCIGALILLGCEALVGSFTIFGIMLANNQNQMNSTE